MTHSLATTTPAGQALLFAERARAAGRAVGALVFEGADHGTGGVNCAAGRSAVLRFLKQHEIQWLTSASTLRDQTSLSLLDRCRHFRREFPDAQINPTLLRKVYNLNGIKKKKFRWHKSPKEQDPEKQRQLLTTMKRQLTRAKNDGYRVVYIDETMFTRKTVAEWSRPKENMAVDVKLLDEPTLALLCGISKEKGVEHHRVFEFSVNVERFIEYLDGLRAANGDDKIALFMDNLSAHTSERSKQAMKERGFRWIYNVPYRCDLNPIELSFSMVKRHFKSLRAQKMMGLIQDSHESLVTQAVQKIKKKDIISCVNHVHKLLQ